MDMKIKHHCFYTSPYMSPPHRAKTDGELQLWLKSIAGFKMQEAV